MPIYRFCCEKCGSETEVLKQMGYKSPVCCDTSMLRIPVAPAVITMKGKGGAREFSKGYKDGYARDYQKDVPVFEPRDVGAKHRSNASLVNK